MIFDFTVIIPTYNEEENIEVTLLNLKKQKTRASYEVIVVDGGSTDSTREIASKYVHVIKSPRKGKAYQLNYATTQTRSKYIIFLDADTVLPDNYIERVFNEFEKDPELWACSGPMLYTGVRYGIWHAFVVIQAVIDFAQFAFFQCIWFLLKLIPRARFKLMQVNYFYNLSMFIYYSIRHVLKYTEFTGSNICVQRIIFEEIGGFRQPPKLGVDMLFCSVMRHQIQKRKRGKMKLIFSLFVETDVRHLETRRSLSRLSQHRSISPQ